VQRLLAASLMSLPVSNVQSSALQLLEITLTSPLLSCSSWAVAWAGLLSRPVRALLLHILFQRHSPVLSFHHLHSKPELDRLLPFNAARGLSPWCRPKRPSARMVRHVAARLLVDAALPGGQQYAIQHFLSLASPWSVMRDRP
jgi:hypothetical protein